MAGDEGSSLLDGILDEILGLKGLSEYDEDRRGMETAGTDACNGGGKVNLMRFVLLLVICKLTGVRSRKP